MKEKKREISLIGQVFGNRMVVADYCSDADWLNIGKKIPSNKNRYVLSKCICGMLLPVIPNAIKRYPPKRCSFCSGINHKSSHEPFTNSWAVYADYAVLNILYKEEVISIYIDIKDYDRLSKMRWRLSKKKNKFYSLTGSKFKNNVTYMHKAVLGDIKIPKGYEIDHIDGNSLNNRRANLRVISRLENIQNAGNRIDSQIGIRGISKTQSKKFQVDFSFNKQRFYFNKWNTLEEAVYCRKFAEEYFGLEIIERNPLAKQYLTLSKEKQEEIKTHTLEKISRK